MLEYHIVVSANRMVLADKMRTFLNDGWKPEGGPVVAEHDKEIWQAITREVKVPVQRSDDRSYKIHSETGRPIQFNEELDDNTEKWRDWQESKPLSIHSELKYRNMLKQIIQISMPSRGMDINDVIDKMSPKMREYMIRVGVDYNIIKYT